LGFHDVGFTSCRKTLGYCECFFYVSFAGLHFCYASANYFTIFPELVLALGHRKVYHYYCSLLPPSSLPPCLLLVSSGSPSGLSLSPPCLLLVSSLSPSCLLPIYSLSPPCLLVSSLSPSHLVNLSFLPHACLRLLSFSSPSLLPASFLSHSPSNEGVWAPLMLPPIVPTCWCPCLAR